MRRFVCAVIVLLLCSASAMAQVSIVRGPTLSSVINNLYGGNGIQLRTTGHEAHFGETLDFQQFASALEKTLQARPVFPIPSSVGVLSVKFNEETGTYDRVQGTSGPLLAERATTSGKGHANISLSYTFSDFEVFNGGETIPLTLRHCLTVNCVGNNPDAGFAKDVIAVDVRLKLKSQVLATSAVYGVTDRLDVGVVVPLIRNDLNVFTRGRVVVHPLSDARIHIFDPNIEAADQLGIGHAIGIGDVIVRGKYQLPLKLPVETAVLADITLPSGDKDNFLGTGDLRVKTTFVASVTRQRFSPHLNVGYEWNSGTTELSNVEYKAGTEILARPRLTVAIDLLGVIQPSVVGEFRVRALNGQSLIPRSVIDGAIGAKWQITERSLLNVNYLAPLNSNGIRPNNIITFGLQFGM